MAAPTPPAVLWDMDGTLVDSEPYWFEVERALVEEFGNTWPDHRAKAMVGFDLMDTAAYMQEHGGVDLPADELVNRLLDGVIERLRDRVPWRPGARRLLAQLRAADVPCVLVTMSWRRFVDPILEALPDDSFVTTIVGDEIPAGKGKPDPFPYLEGAKAAGFAPQRCVALEDSPTGIRAALGAGCPVVGVPNMKPLEPANGLTLVGSLEEVDIAMLAGLAASVEPSPGDPVEHHHRADPADTRPHQRKRLLVLGGLSVVAAAAIVVALRGGSPTPQPTPPGQVAIDAWAPYWTLADTLPETSDRFADLREVSPFWYGVTGIDSITVDEHTPAESAERFVEQIETSDARLVPSIRDQLPAGEMAAILADPATRAQHIDALTAFAETVDADGLDLDYEQFAFADGRASWADTQPNWVAFIESLAEQLHRDNRTLTVSVPPVYAADPAGDRGFWVYDHGAIAAYVDAIRIMAYDFSVAEPGPIAPLPWVQDAVDGTTAVVPEQYRHKLVLGIASYGNNWVIGTSGVCPSDAAGRSGVTARSVGSLAVRRDGVPVFDPVLGEWSFSYELTVDDGTTSCVQSRRVHWVDAEGAASRVEIARRANWGGVSLWALGYEDQQVWESIIAASTTPIDDAVS